MYIIELIPENYLNKNYHPNHHHHHQNHIRRFFHPQSYYNSIYPNIYNKLSNCTNTTDCFYFTNYLGHDDIIRFVIVSFAFCVLCLVCNKSRRTKRKPLKIKVSNTDDKDKNDSFTLVQPKFTI